VGAKVRWIAPPPHLIHQAKRDEAAERIRQMLVGDESEPLWSEPGKTMLEACAGITDGDPKPIGKVLNMFRVWITFFNGVVAENADKMPPIAGHYSLWPVLSGISPKVVANNQRFFTQIGLATQISPEKHAADIGIVKTPAKRIAIELIHLISSIRLSHATVIEFCGERKRMYRPIFESFLVNLFHGDLIERPKYTDKLVDACISLLPLVKKKSIAERWWTVGKAFLMLNTAGKPEEWDVLYKLGWYNETHHSSVRSVALTPYDAADEAVILNPSSADANVRAAIFKRLKKEFWSVALNAPETAVA
jgi:hypothetical protein